MKVKNLLAVAALCLVSASASAQAPSWGGLYFQYNPTWLTCNYDNVDTEFFHGFTFGYNQSIGVAGDKVPLFLEVGGNFQYGLHTAKEGNVRSTAHLLTFNVPVNFGYSIRLGDRLALNPYVGLKMRLHLLGVETYDVKGAENCNLFSSDDMGDARWNRFQIGGQIGVKLIINKAFFVETGYYMDFSPISNFEVKNGKDYRARTGSVNFGFGLVW